MEASAFTTPSTPGWELFRNALNVFLSDDPTSEASAQISASLVARQKEFIPDDHRQEICDLVLQAGIRSSDASKDYEIADSVIHFIHHQVGRDKLTEMLAANTDWEIEECDCPNGVGYHVYTTDRQRFRDGVRRERSRDLMGSLFGGMGRLVEVDLDELMRRRQTSEKTADEPAPSSN